MTVTKLKKILEVAEREGLGNEDVWAYHDVIGLPFDSDDDPTDEEGEIKADAAPLARELDALGAHYSHDSYAWCVFV